MLISIILWTNGLAFIGFGVTCFFVPTFPAELIGYSLDTADSYIEIRAMYGGLQTVIGMFTLLGAIQADFRRASLILIMLVYQGLAIGRTAGLLLSPDQASTYTYGAGIFEVLMAVLIIFCVVGDGGAKRVA